MSLQALHRKIDADVGLDGEVQESLRPVRLKLQVHLTSPASGSGKEGGMGT